MNPATNRLLGAWNTSTGEACCSMRPPAHHRDAVADGHRLALVVGDEHGRRGGRAQDLDHVGADLRPQVRVEAGERLVEQHQPRGRGQGPGQRDPLALAARQLVGVARPVAAEPDPLEPLVARRPRARGASPSATRRRRSGRRSGGGTGRAPGTPARRGGAPGRRRSSRRRRRRRRGAPRPRRRRARPATTRSSVDLPQPLGPTRASSSPSPSVEVDARRRRRCPRSAS